MKTAPVLLVVLLSVICLSESKDLIVGTSYNNRLLWQQKAEYNSIILKKRVKEVFYSDPGQQIIKVIESIVVENVLLAFDCHTVMFFNRKIHYLILPV